MPILTVEKLTKSFGGLTAVSNVNMVLNEGEMVGLIGPNGAGKTTVFNLLTGVYKPTSGTVTLTRDGTDQVISGRKPCDICKLGLARTFQNIRLFKDLTVLDNVRIAMNKDVKYGLVSSFLHLPTYQKEEKRLEEAAMDLLKLMKLDHKKDELAKNLFDAGIDAVTTANNHAMDRDDAGLFRTINVLRAAGIKTAGTALSMEDFLTPCVIEKNGIKIGLIGATQILNGTAPKIDAENRDFALTRLTEEMVKSQISACTGAGAEFIIIMVHWGYEHQSMEDESQRRFAAKLIDWGADAIIGAHSHCPQPMDWIDAERNGRAIRVPVVYSLGNFISNMSQEYAKIGVFARIRITRDENGVRCEELACLPVYCCRAMPADGGREIHRTLPCFIENGAVANDAGMDESVLRAMKKAYDHVEATCIGERDDIHMIERSEIYAGEA